MADDQFLDAARKRWDSLPPRAAKFERRRLGIPDDLGDTEVVDQMAARLRHRAAARGDEARQALRDGIDLIMAAVLDDEVADVLVAWKRQQDWIRREAGERAAIAAIEDMVPFIDSHEFRTQFAEVGKGFLPFWYAEENFMKRWARTSASKARPSSQGDARLHGVEVRAGSSAPMSRAGLVRLPRLRAPRVARSRSCRFIPDTLPVSMMLASPTESMLPGMSSVRHPVVLAARQRPITALTSMIPELEPTKRAILGDYGAGLQRRSSRSSPGMARQHVRCDADQRGNARYASAQLSAIAQLEANGQGLPDNATPGQQQEFLDRVQNHARVILFAQALSGSSRRARHRSSTSTRSRCSG